MIRVVCRNCRPFAALTTVRLSSVGLVRKTNPSGLGGLLSPWSIIARVAIAVGGVVLQSLMQSFAEEMEVRRRSAAELAAAKNVPMSVPEALQVLGLNHPTPQSVTVPLEGVYREAATVNFRKFMSRAAAAKGGSPYLAGKFSAAYRTLVDPQWDEQDQEKVRAELNLKAEDDASQRSPPRI